MPFTMNYCVLRQHITSCHNYLLIHPFWCAIGESTCRTAERQVCARAHIHTLRSDFQKRRRFLIQYFPTTSRIVSILICYRVPESLWYDFNCYSNLSFKTQISWLCLCDMGKLIRFDGMAEYKSDIIITLICYLTIIQYVSGI